MYLFSSRLLNHLFCVLVSDGQCDSSVMSVHLGVSGSRDDVASGWVSVEGLTLEVLQSIDAVSAEAGW